MRHLLHFFCLAVVFAAQALSAAVHAVSAADNDLVRLFAAQEGLPFTRHDSLQACLARASQGDVVLVLADGYPKLRTMLPADFTTMVREKGLKAFVEFPDQISGTPTGKIRTAQKERCVATSGFFGPALPEMSVLDAGLFSWVSVPDRAAHLRAAKVAGYDKAEFGIAGTESFPLLFESDGILVCTTRISSFQRGRYSPVDSWSRLLGAVFTQLGIPIDAKHLAWRPEVRPSYGSGAQLPADAGSMAVARAAEWYRQGRFLIHPQWAEHQHRHGVMNADFPVGPPMDLKLPSGDGSLGVMEGHYSWLNPDGSQAYRYWLRGDCTAETAMALAIASDLTADPEQRRIAARLLDLLFLSDTFRSPASRDPASASYGLSGWANTQPHQGTYYGDDNARVFLGGALAAELLDDRRWDDVMLRILLANFRTTASTGFRGAALSDHKLKGKAWQELSRGSLIHPAPHYESWLWADYLWLYHKTKRKTLLDKAKRGIATTMELYPRWKWANGMQQERARMILPLAWLVRVEDTPQHRAWLDRMVTELLANQVPCGAIREEVGGKGGRYGAPSSNAQYGSNEAPVIHNNGDPAADMLYTCNFALFGLNEAAHATGDPAYFAAGRKLAEFLLRIQSRSETHPDLDGCWFRAFDYARWEYFGSNADHGWGPWGTITGWTQSLITTSLALQAKDDCYWNRTKNSTIGANIDRLWAEMLPDVAAD